MIKVSVIIPVYGVEKYIEKCAHSLFRQSLDEIEYLFIDDCTPDNSIAIVKKVLESYPNRRGQVVFHKMATNSGQAKVREWGILNAKGEYIANCDSDDWIDETMYEKMYNAAFRDKSEIVICNYAISNNHTIYRQGYIEGYSYDKLIENMFSQNIPYCLWNKLIKRSLFGDSKLQFPSKPHGEDMALCLQLIYNNPKISYINEPLYKYRCDSNTLYHAVSEESVLRKFQAATENARIVEEYYRRMGGYERFKNSIMYIKMTSRDKLLPLMADTKYYNLWKSTFPEINKLIIFNKKIRLKHRIKYILTYFRLYHFAE